MNATEQAEAVAVAGRALEEKLRADLKFDRIEDELSPEDKDMLLTTLRQSVDLEEVLDAVEGIINRGESSRFTGAAMLFAFEEICENDKMPPELMGITYQIYGLVTRRLRKIVAEQIAMHPDQMSPEECFIYGFASGAATMMHLCDNEKKEAPDA